MNSLLFTIRGGELHPMHASQMLRAGYLANTRTAALGTMVVLIGMRVRLAMYKHKDKVEFLNKQLTSQDPEDQIAAEKIKNDLSKIKSAKYPASQAIKHMKHLEAVVNKLYEKACERYLIRRHLVQLCQLEPLAFTDELRMYLFREDVEKDDGIKRSSQKEVLTLQALDQKKDDLFFLSMELMRTLEKENIPIHTATDKEAIDESTVWFHTLCELPNLLPASAETLKALRHLFTAPRQTLNDAADEWLRQCYTDISAAERLATVQQKVIPASLVFRQAVEQNETLRNLGIAHNWGNIARLMIGEVPVPILFRLFQKRKLVSEELLAELQEWARQEGWDKKRWPVMAMEFTKEMMDASFLTGPQEEAAPLTMKKSISLD